MSDDRIDLRIAELLAARLCHELVSPVGAINNGVELLEDDPDFAADAAALIGQSAIQATRRLQFYRIAYGSTVPIAAELGRKAALDLFADGKIECEWPEAQVPAVGAKLACNFLLVAAEALPRGGRLTLAMEPSGGIAILAAGEGARLPAHLPDALVGAVPSEAVDARSVQAAFTGALARRDGFRPSIDSTPAGGFVFRLASGG
ncbi:MAG TPA: histidine phosphotransferase family protein [Aliidongia sp.]|nr:histidine phosphotransferase family protein [Aliidongia sp.]